MKKLKNEEIRNIELNILITFDELCKSHGLKYYLSGGTLLGAIRHKGFIPWDDDIDVCMPRIDYMKFLNILDIGSGNLEVLSNLKGNFIFPYTKIINKNTRIILELVHGNVDNHLWIDVFPIDGLPDSIEEVSAIYRKCNFYRTILGLNDARLGKGTTEFRKFMKYFIKPFACIFGSKRCTDNIERIAAQYPYDESKYVGAITWGLYGIGERMLKTEFEKAVEVEFEGYKFPTFSCWDSYLKGLYGDYMQLPPIEKRKTHNMVAYLIEE